MRMIFAVASVLIFNVAYAAEPYDKFSLDTGVCIRTAQIARNNKVFPTKEENPLAYISAEDAKSYIEWSARYGGEWNERCAETLRAYVIKK